MSLYWQNTKDLLTVGCQTLKDLPENQETPCMKAIPTGPGIMGRCKDAWQLSLNQTLRREASESHPSQGRQRYPGSAHRNRRLHNPGPR